ncbi:hypothetical protein OG618_14005 [Kitasatospora sp. NBC_01246]|uniref:hypothetical protein n=1 Tax=Kitasatospora sp. NBC_01246 TaxID=2903570 RepID=UPI002E35C757|nr:hypothetical protein [Kitasatospora sp. NBC_01246]
MTTLHQNAADLPPSGPPTAGASSVGALAVGALAVGVPAVDVPGGGASGGGVPGGGASGGGASDGIVSCASHGSRRVPATEDIPGTGASTAAVDSRCTMAAPAGDHGTGGASSDGSVPRPRGGGTDGEDVRDSGTGAAEGPGEGAGRRGVGGVGGDGPGDAGRAVDANGQTAARLRAGLADRLRTAHGQGRSLAELAAACRRPVAEVRALLAEALGGTEAGTTDEPRTASTTGPEAFVRLRAPEPTEERSVPVLRAAQAELRTVLSKRPSPSRRLRRMHPEAPGPDRPLEASGAGAAAPALLLPPTTPDPLVGAAGPVAGAGEEADGNAGNATAGNATGGGAPGGSAETPLGILIGGTPQLPEAVGRPEERRPVRVAAEPVRISPGTSLVVLPGWRPAIAVSVSTDQLLSATGLALDQLASAQLSVLINPGALHDRELDLHGWQVGPAGRAGRRGGQQQPS